MSKKYDITIREASQRLGCSISTVRRLIKRGQLSKRYEKGKRVMVIKLSSAKVDQLKDGQVVSLEVYNALQNRYDKLLKKYEVVVYKLGSSETRNKELEAESLRMQARRGIEDRIKKWWKGEN